VYISNFRYGQSDQQRGAYIKSALWVLMFYHLANGEYPFKKVYFLKVHRAKMPIVEET